jgi:hypothetical protein
MPNTANIFYGVYWRTEAEAEDATEVLRTALEADDGVEYWDLLDDLESKYKAKVAIAGDTVTIWFGRGVTKISDDENDFSEMSLLQVLDLEKGTLREELRTEIVALIQELPYAMRDHLSSPGFHTAWSQ